MPVAPLASGPSGNAWGVQLTAPWIVSHQGRLIAFARAADAPTDTLYFQVLDIESAMNTADESAWNGWYRFEFPEAPALAPGNVRWRAEQPPPQLRLAGMDLLTVTEAATAVRPADASFQVFGDDHYLYCFRPSEQGTLYLNRLMLLTSREDDVTLYALEGAWEVRYQRSGLRDVPEDDTDSQSYLDLTDKPFIEPTLELSQVKGIQGGAYSVARVPTADPSKVVWYVACVEGAGVRLFRFLEDAAALTNFTESPHVYPRIDPSLSGGGALTPITGLAPALLFYAEQDGERAAGGREVELPRAGRLMLAIPVTGAGLDAATAIYDFGLTVDGAVPDLPGNRQAVILVDGSLSGGRFTPDTTSPSFPTPQQAAATVQVVDGLTVGSMLLGQVQPHADPVLRMGEDGLVHLYHGGPLATETEATVGWYALVPGLPMAMVAQFDPRVSRVVIAVPWRHSTPSEQPAGSVFFAARQSGPTMTGAQVGVGDVTFGSGTGAQPQPDLCTVTATYPAETGLPAETWVGVPRAVDALAAVLNGAASDDSADPAVAAGNRPFFDFGGKLALARVPVQPPAAPPPPAGGPYPPVLTFVSTRPTIALTSVAVTEAGGAKQFVLAFRDAAGHALQQTWPGLAATVDSYPDVFGGSAAAAAYGYAPGPGSTPLFALTTNAVGVPAPVVLYPAGGGPDVSALTIAVAAAAAGTLDVTFDNGGTPIVVSGVPAQADRFAAALAADPGFQTLRLVVDASGVGGAVVPTAQPAGAVNLRGAAALFDLVGPRDDVTGFVALDGSATAGLTAHTLTPPGDHDPTRMAGFVVTHDDPDAGAPAYITDDPPTAMVNRELAGAAVAQSGAWIRQVPHAACRFTGADSVNVPVAANGAIVPQSANLRPQWDWTLEAWLLPSGGAEQRLVTFHDADTPVPAYAPQLDYRIGLTDAEVLEFGSYAKKPGTPDSSFFLTGTVADVPFLRSGTFTWELWIQPIAVPAPAAGTLGGVIQVGVPGQPNAALSIGLTQDRHVVLRVATASGGTQDLTSQGLVTDDDGDGLPEWTHVAVVATQDQVGTWTLQLYIDAVLDSTFAGVYQPTDDPRGRLTIGRNTIDDASMFGQLTQLRFWSTARTEAEIRRTAFLTLSGGEAGLLGCWPMSGIASGPSGKYLENVAVVTGDAWDAVLEQFTQPVSTADDDVFMSVVASVAGLPAVEAQTLLVNGRWNHIALVFVAGGALELNPPSRFDAGLYDWMEVSPEGLPPGAEFAIDAWLMIPRRTSGAGTIAAQWAWDEAPEDQCYALEVDAGGNLCLRVKIVDDAGKTKTADVTSQNVDLADGAPHHVAAVFVAKDATGDDSNATYALTLYADGVQRGAKQEPVDGATVRLQTSQADLTVGRSNASPADAPPAAVESMALFRGTLGRLRLWQVAPTVAQLFPETEDSVPAFGPPPGLAAEWRFADQTGVIATDSIGGNDGKLTSSSMWSSLRATSTLTFYANGGVVAGVAPYDGTLASATSSQFRLGAPAESGVAGFNGEIAQVSLWGAARTLEAIQDQQFVPLDGDEQDLLACWDFSGAIAGADITGGGNDASPPIPADRVRPSTVPVTNEGSAVINDYGGVVSELSECTPDRMAVGSYVDVRQAGSDHPLAVLKRQYVLDPRASFGRAIQVGLLDLVYVGQVQTRPTLIGYIEGAPPVPSENLTRPFYLSGLGYTSYFNTASVALVQQGSDKVTYSSTDLRQGTLSISTALGIFGIKEEQDLDLAFISKETLDFKGLLQLVFKSEMTWGTQEGSQLSAEWTADQRDGSAVIGEWEPFEADGGDYLDPRVGRRFIPANVGQGLVESLTADLYAVVFHRTGAAVGTALVPNLGIPPDRNVIVFPMRDRYTKAGTLDGKVGLANDPPFDDADTRRGSYFRPAEAYALAASIEQSIERNRAYASQFDWEARGKSGRSDLSDVREHLPVDFDSTPADKGQAGVPRTGIANRYVWTAGGGLHAERQGYASAASRSHVGFTRQTYGGGLHGETQFFVFGLGWQGSLDVLASYTLDVHVGVSDDTAESVSLDVAVQGEPYLHRWDPDAVNDYAGKGAFDPEPAPGKVTAYRFMSFFLPPSTRNAKHFDTIVDPVWKQLSNDPAARALRELDASNPVWRVMHRVTYVERVPPPVSSRPLYTVASDVREPVNVAGNVELLRLVAAALGPGTVPTPVNVGAAVAAVLNPAPTGPGTYPPSVLEGLVPWWRTFLDAARGSPVNPRAAALLAQLVNEVVDYVVAGYRTGVLPRALEAATPAALEV